MYIYVNILLTYVIKLPLVERLQTAYFLYIIHVTVPRVAVINRELLKNTLIVANKFTNIFSHRFL